MRAKAKERFMEAYCRAHPHIPNAASIRKVKGMDDTYIVIDTEGKEIPNHYFSAIAIREMPNEWNGFLEGLAAENHD